MQTTRDDLVRWIEAGASQGFDYMIATSDPTVAPVYYTQAEDGSAGLEDHLVRLFAGGRHVSVIGLRGGRDAQIERFLEPQLPMPVKTEADIRRYFDEMDAAMRATSS